MASFKKQRLTTHPQDDFVLFIIGMRINSYWKIWEWLPVFLSMPKMLKELYKNSDLGFMNGQYHFGIRYVWILQWWKSFEHLESYAHSKNHNHLPAWKTFNEKAGRTGSVGIWHETYKVGRYDSETMYINMKPKGLGAAIGAVPVESKYNTARSRIQKTEVR